ncbi:MAG: chromosome segregation protein SMC [Nitrososphaerales archaeon]|nr:chromosome segregation protein SMC [Nitrososphaerales archaeon]
MAADFCSGTLIKRLEIHNFKSFESKRVSLQLDGGLNVITGPNGSGKSNIIDSIRFCLGENSPKALRVSRLSSLISDTGPKTDGRSAKVTMLFDNSRRAIPVDSDTVSISRELKENGESTYFLNGKRVQKGSLSEILDLALISSEGLNVIPQGMVTRISELLPDEKRRLIESIIGISQFDEKKAEAERQLKEADLRLQVALARIDEIKNRVDELEGERNDQITLKQLEEETKWLKSVIVSRRLTSTRDKILEQKGLIDRCSSELREASSKLEGIRSQIRSLEDERNRFVAEVLDESGAKHVELQFSIAELSNKIEILSSTIKDDEADIKNIDETLPALYRMYSEKLRELEASEGIVKGTTEKLGEIEKGKEEAIRNLSSVQISKERLDRKLSKTNLLADGLRKRVENQRGIVERISKRMAELEVRRSEVLEKLGVLREKNASFSETLSNLEKNLSELQLLKESEQEALKKVDESIASILDRRSKLEDEIEKAISTLDRASEAVLRYEVQRSVAEKVISEELSSRKLKEISEAGAIDGLIGRLDELIEYDKRYEPAVLASAGRLIKAMVVKNLANMLKIAEITKRLKMGRLMIIPLSEVSGIARINPPPIDGALGLISDFISVEDGLRAVVDLVFGDTVLVSSHKAAFMASSRGFRAVTLNGDLFGPKGSAFETGYIEKMDNIINLIRDEASFSAVKEALNPLKKVIAKRRSDLNRLEKESKKLSEEKVKKTLTLERLTAQLTNIDNFLARYRKLQHAILKRMRKLEDGLKKLEDGIEKLSIVHAGHLKRVEAYEGRISELAIQSINDEIRTLDDRKASLNNLIENLSSQIRDFVTQLTGERANLENVLRPGVERLNNQISQLEKEKDKRTKSLEENNLIIKDLKEKFDRSKLEESTLIESKRKSKPILEDYEKRLKRLRDVEEGCLRSINRLEKESLSSNKNLESLNEAEQRITMELSSMGYYEPLETFDGAESVLEKISLEYESLKDRVNLLADSSYRDIVTGYKNLSFRKNQLESERNAIVRFVESVEAEKRRVFINSFEKVDKELRTIFNKLTGGSAWLEIEDPNDIFSSGIFLMTQFPDKAPRESTSTSGGEKTITALAFILSIQSVYPSPFYLFDEIDAHLDAVNLERLAELLKERSKRSQIILVTLRPPMIARASAIYGTYNEDSISKVVRYKPGVEIVVRSS